MGRGFDAGRETGLDYDFTTLTVADPETAEILSKARGIVPEPSQKALDAYVGVIRTLLTQEGIRDVVELGINPSSADVMQALDGLSEDDADRFSDNLTEAVIEICSGSPSREQIEALPPRTRAAFTGWLTRELVDPTQPIADSRPSLVGANGGGPTTG